MSGLAIRHGPVCCAKPGCSLEWPRDPILEVGCPDCGAGVGVRCKRPSGHGGGFVDAHASRDLAADAAGAYGTCPLGICGVAASARLAGKSASARLPTAQAELLF
jgi:hypothetical protein